VRVAQDTPFRTVNLVGVFFLFKKVVDFALESLYDYSKLTLVAQPSNFGERGRAAERRKTPWPDQVRRAFSALFVSCEACWHCDELVRQPREKVCLESLQINPGFWSSCLASLNSAPLVQVFRQRTGARMEWWTFH